MFAAPQMNAVRGGTVTWRPQPWQDGDGGGGEPLSDSDSEEEDFPDDSTTPLGDYITHGETGHGEARKKRALVVIIVTRVVSPVLPTLFSAGFSFSIAAPSALSNSYSFISPSCPPSPSLRPLSASFLRIEAAPGCSAAV